MTKEQVEVLSGLIKELGRVQKEGYDRIIEILSAHCTKCGDLIKGDEDSICQNCA